MAALRIDMTANATTIQFNTKTGDPDYRVQRLDGWGSGAVRLSTSPIVGADKEVVTEAKLAARTIVVGGVVIATTEAAFWTGWNLMITAFEAVSVNGTFKVYETVAKSVTVKRKGDLLLSREGPFHFRWQATLVAVDPAKF